MKPKLAVVLFVLACCCALLTPDLSGAARRQKPAEEQYPVAKMLASGSDVWFEAVVPFGALNLSFTRPDGIVQEQTFVPGEVPHISISTDMPDGNYHYELRVTPAGTLRKRSGEELATEQPSTVPLVQNGSFQVLGGKVLTLDFRSASEVLLDVLHYDDVIITGSLAVGFDAVDGEVFGFDTIKLKENNLRIKFEDTSIGTFPSNDWQLIANDSASGGMNYFAIDDVTGVKTPFKLQAGAPTNSFFMDSTGRIGLKTATPVLDLHVNTSNTPAFRLEQNNSGGFTAQTWDIAGNEANFFVRDVTGGSKLSFRIRPGAPTSSIDIAANGDVGIGTAAPAYSLEVERTGSNAAAFVQRTDGASNILSAGASYANVGSANNFPFRLLVNALWKMQLNADNSLAMASGASCTAGGVWTNASSREYKDNISGLSSEEALNALDGLNPVKFTYKADETEAHVGFIAEDVPDLVATKDKKGLSPMDIIAVLTKVVQEQQKTVQEQQQRISKLNEKLAELEAKVK